MFQVTWYKYIDSDIFEIGFGKISDRREDQRCSSIQYLGAFTLDKYVSGSNPGGPSPSVLRR